MDFLDVVALYTFNVELVSSLHDERTALLLNSFIHFWVVFFSVTAGVWPQKEEPSVAELFFHLHIQTSKHPIFCLCTKTPITKLLSEEIDKAILLWFVNRKAGASNSKDNIIHEISLTAIIFPQWSLAQYHMCTSTKHENIKNFELLFVFYLSVL